MRSSGRTVTTAVCLGLVLTCGACTSVAAGGAGAGARETVASSSPGPSAAARTPGTATASAVEAPTAPAGSVAT